MTLKRYVPARLCHFRWSSDHDDHASHSTGLSTALKCTHGTDRLTEDGPQQCIMPPTDVREDSEITLAWNDMPILPARRYASAGSSYGPVSACLCPSVTSRCSVETDGRNNLGFGMGASIDQSYTVF